MHRHMKANRTLSPIIGVLAVALVSFGAMAKSKPAIPQTIEIPAGPFVRGSDSAEREYGYVLDERAYGHSVTRQGRWYAGELPRETRHLPAYRITRTAITNDQYAAFISATGHSAPDVDRATWKSYGLIHPWKRTRRHAWTDGRVPAGRGDHPVVLVSRADAQAYADWLSIATGKRWQLPSEKQWEKAARGPDGRRFPWGDEFRADRLNSHDSGPFDTVAVGTIPGGASPYGVLDMAGQVFE